MTKVTVDTATGQILNQSAYPIEVCDASGVVLGCFVPRTDTSQYEPVTPNVTAEELQRRKRSSEWFTTSQVLDHLETL
jgi:hypothetical protein